MRIVVMVKGGIVQEVISDEDAKCILIDEDVEDDEQTMELVDARGEKFTAALDEYSVTVSPKVVEHYWNQIPTM